MDEVAGDDVRAAGRSGEVDAGHAGHRRGRRVGERMHGVLRHGLARCRGDGRDAHDRLPGGGGHPAVRVQARGGKVANGVAGDGVNPSGGDDAANLPGGADTGVVVVEIGHRVARDARAGAAGAEDARDLLARSRGGGRSGGVQAVCGGGAAHGVVADGVRPRRHRDAGERGGDGRG